LKQSWRSFTEFGIALVTIKLCIHAREKIAFYSRKLCKSNQRSVQVLLSGERLLSIEAREWSYVRLSNSSVKEITGFKTGKKVDQFHGMLNN